MCLSFLMQPLSNRFVYSSIYAKIDLTNKRMNILNKMESIATFFSCLYSVILFHLYPNNWYTMVPPFEANKNSKPSGGMETRIKKYSNKIQCTMRNLMHAQIKKTTTERRRQKRARVRHSIIFLIVHKLLFACVCVRCNMF